MTSLHRRRPARIVLAVPAAMALALIGASAPVLAQSSAKTAAEARLQKLEAEVKALQRSVFPGGDGKFFPPEISKTPGTATPAPGTPATTPVTDLLTRMDSVEAQLARLTAQGEENANRIALMEAKLAALSPAAPAPAPAATLAPPPAAAPAAAVKPPVAAAVKPPVTATPKGPSAQRLAAVKAVEKPQTGDAADDEYSYGFRLWEAKFYPEAQQQLQLFLDKHPKHQRVSYARNLMGRALLDEGKPREAAQWFLKNYQADKSGARAPDSLLYLAESMRLLKDTSRACIALGEFADGYKAEAAGRLRTQYEATRAGVKCN